MKLLLALLTLTFSFQSMAVTIGIVNMQKVINTIKEGQSVMKTLEGSFNKMKKELKDEEMKIGKSKEKIDKQSMVLSDKAKVKKQQELQKMMIDLQKKTAEYQRKIQQQELELKEPILKKLKEIVESVSKNEGVDMTMEISSPIIYAKDKKDITDAVIKAYDKKHSK